MRKKFLCILAALLAATAQMSYVCASEGTVAEGALTDAPVAINQSDIAPRYQNIFVILPSFSITGSTASCALDVECFEDSISVTATVILYEQVGNGRLVIDSWIIEETGSITWSDTAKVTGGKYIMAVTVTSGSDRYSKELVKYC